MDCCDGEEERGVMPRAVGFGRVMLLGWTGTNFKTGRFCTRGCDDTAEAQDEEAVEVVAACHEFEPKKVVSDWLSDGWGSKNSIRDVERKAAQAARASAASSCSTFLIPSPLTAFSPSSPSFMVAKSSAIRAVCLLAERGSTISENRIDLADFGDGKYLSLASVADEGAYALNSVTNAGAGGALGLSGDNEMLRIRGGIAMAGSSIGLVYKMHCTWCQCDWS